MNTNPARSPSATADGVPPKRYRTACNTCHHMKLRCSGQSPCTRCHDSGYECVYKLAAKLGKPKGSKNKRTLERLRQRAESLQGSTSSQQNAIVEKDQGLTSDVFTPSSSLSKEVMSSAQIPAFLSRFSTSLPVFHGNSWQYTPASESNATSYSWDEDSGQFDVDLIGPWTCPISPSSRIATLHSSASAFGYDFSHPNSTPPIVTGLDMVTDDYFRNYWITGLQSDAGHEQGHGQISNPNILDHQLKPCTSPEPMNMNTCPSAPPAAARIPDSASSSPPCNCISKQLDSYCRLKVIDDQNSPMTPTTTILTSSDILTTIQTLLECTRCHIDQHTLFDIIITLRLILRWLFKMSQQQAGSTRVTTITTTLPVTKMTAEQMRLKLGDHEISDQEQLRVIKKTLGELMLSKASKVLQGVRNSLHRLENSNSHDGFNFVSSVGTNAMSSTDTTAAADKLDALYLHLTLTQLETSLESVRHTLLTTVGEELEDMNLSSSSSSSASCSSSSSLLASTHLCTSCGNPGSGGGICT